jgi:hypothetical protein
VKFCISEGAQLNGAVRVLAADFGFREAVASKDIPTILSAIENHGSRIDAGVVVLIDVDGHVIASTVPELAANDRAELREMVEHPPSRSDSPAIRMVAGRPYQLVLAPVRAPEVIAWVAMGFVINDKLAADMAQPGRRRGVVRRHRPRVRRSSWPARWMQRSDRN